MTLSKEFRKKAPKERLDELASEAKLTEEEKALLAKESALDLETANRMIENVVSTFPLPFGVVPGFKVNGIERLVPMAVEEPSVVAASANAAKLSEGFTSEASEPVMIGQIQLLGVKDVPKAIEAIEAKKKELVAKANEKDRMLISRGGGAKGIECRHLKSKRGDMLIVHLLVNVQDAMGANTINTMCEILSPELEKLSGGKVRLRIISNLAVHRTVKAKTVWTKEALEESTKGAFKGSEVVGAVLDAYAFAEADPYRACTHNKGAMNGIDAVLIATGNDWRAVEAGAHAFASLSGEYKPLTKYYKNEKGDLVGEIELPMAIGIVGGATKTHPLAKIALKIMGVTKASELAEIIAAVGLTQNFAALRALATEGIQRGHMRLHAKNIAVMAGAHGKEIEEIADKMAGEKNVSVQRAKELLGSK
ncbi:hydroxymethylglutaryl-CoA reductase, degradative [Candidatus Micrarchaeota archaeon]|nr:hydroxymethylglutaryl-CoA reductase, degradative [Candidatus Micrarchaeota archaeon]